ncbi:hypothetical protein [Streptomyces lichenis]|uniref:Uncharacterized protein n=1 Tax=Streptomyces lichenis TaxID=2306967 RepID=A0ABT0IH05_9ACTN|nr:hypothetical protein [Streptomyces lichenis]MCK8680607.1 hypothetical protein [Streptomyces lichenis]
MPKKRKTDRSFAEVVASLGPAEGSGPGADLLSPASSGELVDEQGRLWTRHRGPMDVRLVRRLVRGADAMLIGEGAGEVLRPVPAEGREEAWALVKDRLDTAEGEGYRAYDFRSEDGCVLLYLEEFC